MFAAKEIILLTLRTETCIMETVAMINGRVDITVKVELTICSSIWEKCLF